jgi:multidrug efflux system membrane fusion protein
MAEGPLPVQAIAADGTTVIESGKVTVINNQVDQTTGTVQLKGEFPNSRVQLWPGQFINIRVLINTLRQGVVIPTAAVQRGPDGTFVYIVKDDNSVTVRPVMVQQQDDLQAVIASGLMAAERVVTTGFGRLAEGTRVEVTSAEEAGQVSADPSQPPARRDGAPRGKGEPKGKGQRAPGAGVQGAGAPGAEVPGAAAQSAGTQGTGGPPSATP